MCWMKFERIEGIQMRQTKHDGICCNCRDLGSPLINKIFNCSSFPYGELTLLNSLFSD
jgi:hypothetical protein